MTVLLKPYESLGSGNSASRFYLADCLDVFRQLPAHSVDVIVTSPPYNLGIQYSRYQDSLSAAEYLEWTNRWVAAAARVLRPDGSLFLNVGAKPTDPWTALDVAQAVREVRPYGVDCASGVESAAGIKDHDRVRRFVAAAKEAT